jgi:hypothetical protein
MLTRLGLRMHKQCSCVVLGSSQRRVSIELECRYTFPKLNVSNIKMLTISQTCRNDPNAPLTDPRSQFPPCLPNGGKNGALPPCQANSRCAKVDNSCNDWNFKAQGGCIGICVPKSIGAAQVPKGGNWGPQPQQQQQQPKGGNWGPQPQQPQQPKGGQWAPQQAPGAWQPKGPGGAMIQSCPEEVRSRCPGNSACVADPRFSNTFSCTNEDCVYQTRACNSGKLCVPAGPQW